MFIKRVIKCRPCGTKAGFEYYPPLKWGVNEVSSLRDYESVFDSPPIEMGGY
jgi:hypothetical protein